MDFSGKVVLITGASGGLGQTVVRKFAEQGAQLALIEHEPGELAEVFGDLDNALVVSEVNVTDPDSVARMAERVITTLGRVDVLVNIVGGWRGGSPLHKTSLETWDFLMNLNARSVFLVSQAIIPHMLEEKSGKIVSVAAKSGLQGGKGNAVYSASKSVVIRLTESMSAELKNDGINVNCVLPSIIDTPPNREAMPNADFSKWVTPDALADVILFLASDAARAVHGAAIPVFGRV